MTASLFSRSLEDRDPSPVPTRSISYPSEDDDVDEPWDETARSTINTQRSKSPLLACVGEYFDQSNYNDEALEDGDLPSLSKKPRPTPLLNVRTATTKPLRPPSMLGLEGPPVVGSAPRSSRGRDNSKWGDDEDDDEYDDDEAPEDELASLEMRGIQKKKTESKQNSDEHYVERDDEDTESQFCDVASMLSDMCGENSMPAPEAKAMPIKKTLRAINDIPMGQHAVEEQTAIEIEYVDPGPRAKAAASSKKNTYLTAMARKAKEDFNKTLPEKKIVEQKKLEAAEVIELKDVDVYSSFSAAEKRKFLKMVNSGMTPTNSAKRIMDDREAASPAASGRRGLAFWKKPKPERSVSPDVSKKNSSSPVKVAFADSPPETFKKPEVEDRVVPKESEYDQYESAGFDSESDDEKMDAIDEEDDRDESDGMARSKDTFIAIGAPPVNPAAVVAVISNKRSAPSVQEVLPKSGSNYYDAVRQEDDNDGKFRNASIPATKVNQGRVSHAAAVRSPTKQNGFTPLDEQSDKATRTLEFDNDGEDKAELSPRLPVKRASKASSVRRFNMRGIRPNGFAAVPGGGSPDRKQKNDGASEGVTMGVDSVSSRAAETTAYGETETASACLIDDAAVRDLLGTTPSIFLSDDRYLTPQSYVAASEGELGQEKERSSHPYVAARSGGLTVDPVLPEEGEQSSFDLITPLSMAESPQSRTVEVYGDPSLGHEHYVDTQTYSNNLDQMSVVSGKSHWTAATGATNFTTSSRVRRPGAAKNRLANAKKAQITAVTKKGWHESIKSAAVKSNQIWDPKDGFLDYEESKIERGELSGDVIRIELKGLKRKSAGQQVVPDVGAGESSRAPAQEPGTPALHAESDDDIVWEEVADDNRAVEDYYPEEEEEEYYDDEVADGDIEAEEDPHQLRSDTEEEEDDSILNDSVDGGNMQQGIQSDVRLLGETESDDEDVFLLDSSVAQNLSTDLAEADLRALPTDGATSPALDGQNRDWIETMKMASAKYARDGATWDPETGWQGLNEESEEPDSLTVRQTGIDPLVAPSLQSRPEPLDPDGVSPAGAATEVTLAGSTAAVNTIDHIRDRDTSVDQFDGAGSRSEGILFSMDPLSADLTDRPRPPSQTSRSIGDADTITTIQDEKYIQIGDTGSVRSFSYNQSPVDPAVRTEVKTSDGFESRAATFVATDPLVEESGTEDDTAPLLVGTDFVRATDTTQVVKEKNNEDDISLFAHDSRNSFPKLDNPVQAISRRGVGPVDVDEVDDFKRRGQGPVDIDEIDDMELDDDDDERWASAQIGSITAVPLTVASSKAKKLSMTSPPKIKAPEKDTSPHSDRRRGVRTARVDPSGTAGTETNSLRASELSPQSLPLDPNEVWNSVYGDVAEVDNRPIVSREDPKGISSRTASLRSADMLATSSPEVEGTSVVKSLARQWESRVAGNSPKVDQSVEGDVSKTSEKSPSGAAEWKSFLDKKVSAEGAAAARLQATQGMRPDPSEGRKRADPTEEKRAKDPNGSFQDGQDDDSIFEFRPSARDETGAFPTARSDLCEVDDSFSDISPIQAREDEYDDDFEDVSRSMEAVSDTGTNIEQGSFFKRLQACAAPILQGQFPQPHSGEAGYASFPSSRFVSSDVCGRPGTISEVEALSSPVESERSSSSKRSKQRSSPRYAGSEARSITSNDGFGSKTSYLESLAMEAAVSKPKRHGSRGRAHDEKSRSSNMSDVSTASSRRSEKWQEFVDRKSIGISPEKLRSESVAGVSDHSSDVSKAAERYAAQKVEAMMEAMSRRREVGMDSEPDVGDGQFAGGRSPNKTDAALSPYDMKGVRSDGSRTVRSAQVKNESVRAAEELAAARVEAMMAAMTSQSLEEGEI